VTDPFGLTRGRVRVDRRDELLVTPEVEDLTTAPEAATGHGVGAARARQLMPGRLLTMRSYEKGRSRRIHWPSSRARPLMIRQNEASRRASAVVFLDDRETGLGHRDRRPNAPSRARERRDALLENFPSVRDPSPATPVGGRF
jgi:uncharacterized protein (DUF58 family)